MNNYPRRLAVHRLIERVSPIPAKWVTNNEVTKEVGLVFKKKDGLWWPKAKEHETVWTKRCLEKGNEHLPWALWSGMRALGVDTLQADPEGPTHDIAAGSGDGALAVADGYRFAFRRKRAGDFLLRMGRRDSGDVLVPGLTIEEKASAQGFRLVRNRASRTSGNNLLGATEKSLLSIPLQESELPTLVREEDDIQWFDGSLETFDFEDAEVMAFDVDTSFDNEDTYGDYYSADSPELDLGWEDGEGESLSRLEELLELELEHAKNWMKADLQLAMVALLGPLPMANHHGWLWRRRKAGYVGYGGYMTKAGWWRLAYLAEQGVGLLERHRQKRLSRVRHPRHLRIVQNLCLDLVNNEGCVPLGVEYSALAYYITQDSHNYRSDALLVDADGALVWVEVMRRELDRLGEKTKIKYELLEKDFLPPLADKLQRPIRYILRVPSGIYEKVFLPETEPAF